MSQAGRRRTRLGVAVATLAALTAWGCVAGHRAGTRAETSPAGVAGGTEGVRKPIRHSGPIGRAGLLGEWVGTYTTYPAELDPKPSHEAIKRRWDAYKESPKCILSLRAGGGYSLTFLPAPELMPNEQMAREESAADTMTMGGTWRAGRAAVSLRPSGAGASNGGAKEEVLTYDGAADTLAWSWPDGIVVTFRRRPRAGLGAPRRAEHEP